MMTLDHDIQHHLNAKTISHYEAYRSQTGRNNWKALQQRHCDNIVSAWPALTHEDRCLTVVTAIMAGEEGRRIVATTPLLLKFVSDNQDELVALRVQLQEQVADNFAPHMAKPKSYILAMALLNRQENTNDV